ncbi:unnamed protein product [Diamesa serratosioi]
MWPEVEKAKAESKRELMFTGPSFSEQLKKNNNELDKDLLKIKVLNFLTIKNSEFMTIPKEINLLENLQSLLLFGNKIEVVPESINQLSKLKVLDFSNNNIKEFNFDCAKMESLFSVNLSGNQIKNFRMENATVHILEMSNNKLQEFPIIPSVVEMKLNNNEITELPDNIPGTVLKFLEMTANKVTAFPKSFATLKLKTLNLKDNPLKDKKLLKLIDQNQSIKSIMDYIAKNGSTTGAPKKVSKDSTEPEILEVAEPIVVVPTLNRIVVDKCNPDFKIIYDAQAKDVRSHIFCCVIKNCSLNATNLKEFLQMQTKLHDTICKKRELATIATHDFDLIQGSTLKYTIKPKADIKIKPLGRQDTVTAEKFFNSLVAEAENIRKEKKRSAFTGIHKFLHLLENQEKFAFLENENGTQVLSLPPMTNSETTKLSINTKRILVEVTSEATAAICKEVMSQLLQKSLNLNICASDNEDLKQLSLEQVKIVDKDGGVKTLYPSKVDLIELESDKVTIERNC